MTTPSNRLAKKMALFSEAAEVFRLSSGEGDEFKRSGLQFEKDFPRTSEIELIINKKSQLHYKRPQLYYEASEASESETGLEAASKQSEFTALLKGQRPELESVIRLELNQAGAFSSGRILLETIFFPKVAIEGSERNHRFIVEVINRDEVTITEIVSYQSLKLLPLSAMLPSASEEEKTDLESYRNSRDIKTKLEAQQDNDPQVLLFRDGQPLSLTIQYTLRYCKEVGTYKLNVPSKEDITLTVPTSLAKSLVSGEKWTAKDKVFEFISRIVEVIKKLVIAKVSEHLASEQSRQDQAKPSEESQFSSFAQRMRV